MVVRGLAEEGSRSRLPSHPLASGEQSICIMESTLAGTTNKSLGSGRWEVGGGQWENCLIPPSPGISRLGQCIGPRTGNLPSLDAYVVWPPPASCLWPTSTGLCVSPCVADVALGTIEYARDHWSTAHTHHFGILALRLGLAQQDLMDRLDMPHCFLVQLRRMPLPCIPYMNADLAHQELALGCPGKWGSWSLLAVQFILELLKSEPNPLGSKISAARHSHRIY